MTAFQLLELTEFLAVLKLSGNHFIRDLRSFEIRLKLESAVPIRFESDGPIRKFSNWLCVPIAGRSETTQTINGA